MSVTHAWSDLDLSSLLIDHQGALAGVASGLTKLVVGHPFDTVKVRLQTEGYSGRFQGPIHCLRSTVQNEGFRSLYKGASAPLMFYALTDSLHIGTYSLLYKKFTRNNKSKNPDYTLHALAGFVGGCVSSVTATPMEQIKLRLQVQYKGKAQYSGAIDCMQQLVRSRGLRLGLWTGFVPTVMLRSHFALLWPTFHYTKQTLETPLPNQRFIVPLLSGGIAYTVFWLVAFPYDLVKNRMMKHRNFDNPPSILEIVRSVYRADGLRGFYRGLAPTLLRSFPTNGAALLAYDLVINRLRQN